MLFTETIEIDPRTAIVEENGGAVVAPMLRATNRIATALADEFPTVLFDTFAYSGDGIYITHFHCIQVHLGLMEMLFGVIRALRAF